MKNNILRHLLLCCAAVSAAVAFAQGLVICPSCGREGKTGDAVCSHCQAKMPGFRAEKPKAEPPPVDPKAERQGRVSALADQTVRENLKQMRELTDRQPAVAFYYAVNALAVRRLLPADFYPEQVSNEILNGHRQLLAKLNQGWKNCRTCEGHGKIRMRVEGRDGKVNEGPLKPCPKCGGKGKLRSTASVEQVVVALNQGSQEFTRQQMAAGAVRLGRIFVPADLPDLLTSRQKALVMTGAAHPCQSCQLTGRQTCSACKGTGETKCTQPDCVNGVIQEKKARGNRKITIDDKIIHECDKCVGTGFVNCLACRGTGGIPCRRCNGTGLSPECRRCAGTGIAACTKCRGTGEVRGTPCPDCKGELETLCPTCRGEGAIVR